MADQDKPTPVALNLDKIERESAPEPFVVTLDGKRISFEDPQELDWQVLMVALRDPHAFFKHVVPEEHQDTFFKPGLIPLWKMNRLMEAYMSHHGIPVDAGNVLASSR